MTAEPARSRRERTRDAAMSEIKSTALQLMREQDNVDVRFAEIARAMGMTARDPQRYFDDRDDLLSALITDGFDALSQRIAEARRHVADDDDIGGRWLAAAAVRPRARVPVPASAAEQGKLRPPFDPEGLRSGGGLPARRGRATKRPEGPTGSGILMRPGGFA